jgi:hypothetical protein
MENWGKDQVLERVITPCPISITHYDFEKSVKETKIPSRKHYENVLVVKCPSDSLRRPLNF